MTTPELAEAVAEVFHRFAPNGVAMEHQGSALRVVAYLPVGDGLPRVRRQLQEAMGHLSFIVPLPELQEREVADEDWLRAFREAFQPFRVGEGLVIAPPWASYQPAPGEILLVVEPGMAFGTGLHPTTQMCLVALERHISPGMAVLDLGTGSGILAIAAARLGAASVLALDVDPEAVRSARENLATNGIPQGTVTVAQGTLEGPSQPQFDLVAANLTATILERLATQIVAALKPGGMLIASGILEDQAQAVAQRFLAEGTILQETIAREDWRSLLLRR